MKFKENWEETKERFKAWWNRSNTDRPLLRIAAKRKTALEPLEPVSLPATPEEQYLNVEQIVKSYRNYCHTHSFMAEAYPNLSVDLGPGSMALYLGSEPGFAWDTVWFKECVKTSWQEWGPLQYDADNYWWRLHLDLIRRAHEMADGDFLVNIPDIIENVDILSAMRGPQEFCFDLVDEPDLIKSYVEQVDELYFKYYDAMYDIIKGEDGSSSFTAFQIWGPGKTAKIQCDFCALMSPGQFREFAQPSLRKQCQRLDHSLYHLDGPDAIKHLDALMEIEELDALQWTAGAAQPDGGSERWYPIYDKVREAGKCIWTMFYDGDVKDWVESADKLVRRYGPGGFYFLFPEMEESDALELIAKAEKDWR